MSLAVTDSQLDSALKGRMDATEFIGIVRASLPFAYDTVERLARRVRSGERVAIAAPLHMADSDRNQLLRALASTAMRRALSRHFGVRLAFQNCHYVAATTGFGRWSRSWREFTSLRSQVLAQRPELRDC